MPKIESLDEVLRRAEERAIKEGYSNWRVILAYKFGTLQSAYKYLHREYLTLLEKTKGDETCDDEN